jgi:hypothetical protein
MAIDGVLGGLSCRALGSTVEYRGADTIPVFNQQRAVGELLEAPSGVFPAESEFSGRIS